MTTVTTTTPEFGTVEHHAAMIRRYAHTGQEVYPVLVGIIEGTVDSKYDSDSDMVRYIRNAIEAANLVRAELRQAGR